MREVPHKCPVCDTKGKVNRKQCHGCDGKGWIVLREYDQPAPYIPYIPVVPTIEPWSPVRYPPWEYEPYRITWGTQTADSTFTIGEDNTTLLATDAITVGTPSD